jgi:hypothetical protein
MSAGQNKWSAPRYQIIAISFRPTRKSGYPSLFKTESIFPLLAALVIEISASNLHKFGGGRRLQSSR